MDESPRRGRFDVIWIALVVHALLQGLRVLFFDTAVVLDHGAWLAWGLPAGALLVAIAALAAGWPRGGRSRRQQPWGAMGIVAALATGMLLVRDIDVSFSRGAGRAAYVTGTLDRAKPGDIRGRRGDLNFGCVGAVLTLERAPVSQWTSVRLPCRLVVDKGRAIVHDGALGIAWLDTRVP